MRKSRVYVDTSVTGGCCDSEFQEWSNGLLEDFEAERYGLLLSSLTDAEIEDAPKEVKDVYLRFRELAQEVLDLSDEAIGLADEYLRHGVIRRVSLTTQDISPSRP